jgi:hypothetical protein
MGNFRTIEATFSDYPDQNMLGKKTLLAGRKSSPPPRGFINVTTGAIGDRHTYLQCSKTIVARDGSEKRCRFLVRKDGWKEHPERLKHECDFGVSIEDYMKQPEERDPRIDLDESLYNLCAHCELSFSLMVSSELNTVIQAAVRLGQNNSGYNPRDIFSTQSRNTFRKRFMEMEKGISSEVLGRYREFGCAAIAMDAGSIKSRPMLTINLVNACLSARTGIGPFLLSIVTDFEGTKESYRDALLEAVQEMERLDIRLTGLVGDNLSVQLGAMTDFARSAMETPEMPGVVICPCACHTLALAFNDTVKESKYMAGVYRSLKAVSELLRSKPVASRLSIICPSFCQTRWNHAFYIAEFICRNAGQIMDFIEENVSNIEPEVCRQLLQCIIFDAPVAVMGLAFLSAATRALEADDCPAMMIPVILKNYYHRASELKRESAIEAPFLQELEDAITRRFDGSEFGGMYYVMMSLTPEGREAIRSALLSKSYSVQAGCGKGHLKFIPYVLTLDDREADVVALVRLNIRFYIERATEVELLFSSKNGAIEILGPEFEGLGSRGFMINRAQWKWMLEQRKIRNESGRMYYTVTSRQQWKQIERDELSEESDDIGTDPPRESRIVQLPGEVPTNRPSRDGKKVCDWMYMSCGISQSKRDIELAKADKDLLESEAEWREALVSGHKKGTEDSAGLTIPAEMTMNDFVEEVRGLALYLKMDADSVVNQWILWITETFPLGKLEVAEPPGDAAVRRPFFDEPWRSVAGTGVLPELVDFALHLLAIPASEASCERSISQERDILGENRYRLTKETLTSQLRSRTQTKGGKIEQVAIPTFRRKIDK